MNSREITLTLSALLVIASATARFVVFPETTTQVVPNQDGWEATNQEADAGTIPRARSDEDVSRLDPTRASPDSLEDTQGQTPRDRSPDGSWILTGRILGASGVPIQDASVSCEVMRSRADGSSLLDEAQGLQTTTGPQGRFEISTGRSDSMNITLWIHAPGHAHLLSDHVLESGGTEGQLGDIRMPRGGAIAGRVLGPSATGLQGAQLILRPNVRGRRARLIQRLGILTPIVTGPGGSFQRTRIMPGSYETRASAPGMQETRQGQYLQIEDGKTLRVDDIQLVAGFALAGMVQDPAGRGVAGADLRIRSAKGGAGFDQTTRSREDGGFRIDHLPAGLLEVEVRAKGLLSFRATGIDPTQGKDLIIRLQEGLQITGQVLDAANGQAVRRYAAKLELIRPLDLDFQGEPAVQIQRKLDAIKTRPQANATAAARLNRLALVETLQARLSLLRHKPAIRRRLQPGGIGPIQEHEEGRFSFVGLDEGVYSIAIGSPGHQGLLLGPIELRRGGTSPTLIARVTRGNEIQGRVILGQEDKPVKGVSVTLLAVDEFDRGKPLREGPRLDWLFAAESPLGVALDEVLTDATGSFRFQQACGGRYFLRVHGTGIVTLTSPTLDITSHRRELLLRIQSAAAIEGQVRGIPPAFKAGVQVLAVGGFGASHVARTDDRGRYRIDGMQPGSYRVRAFVGDADKFLSQQVRLLLAKASEEKKQGRRILPDLVLRAGERKRHDLSLEREAAGSVRGRVTLHNQPAPLFWAVLRPMPGPAPGPGARSVSKQVDLHGSFVFPDTLVGKYRLQVYSPRSQRLHEEVISVSADQNLERNIDLVTGGLSGRIRVPASTDRETIRGSVYVLPGATTEPADLREYRKTHPVHRLSVRKGVFHADHLTPGVALAIVRIRGYATASHSIHIPTGSTRRMELAPGKPE